MKKFSPIIIFCLFAVITFGIYEYNLPKLDVNFQNIGEIDKPLVVSITTTKQDKEINFDEVKINFYHKYKKDEIVEETLNPYELGKYKLIYFPQYHGEYLGTVSGKIGDKQIIKQINFTVE